MREQNANIGPRYAVRLRDLRNWHVLTAVCGGCRHRCRVWLWQLKARHPDHARLTDIELKLRCLHCGNRAGNRVLVTVADQD
jgi:hypothetical protein